MIPKKDTSSPNSLWVRCNKQMTLQVITWQDNLLWSPAVVTIWRDVAARFIPYLKRSKTQDEARTLAFAPKGWTIWLIRQCRKCFLAGGRNRQAATDAKHLSETKKETPILLQGKLRSTSMHCQPASAQQQYCQHQDTNIMNATAFGQWMPERPSKHFAKIGPQKALAAQTRTGQLSAHTISIL